MAESQFASIEELVAQGEFLSAVRALEEQPELRRTDSDRYTVLWCQVRHHLGHSSEVFRPLERVAQRLAAEELGGLAYGVLTGAALATGQVDAAERFLQSARLSLRNPRHAAEVELDRLSNFGSRQPFEAVLAALQNVRKLVVRAGDPRLNVALRLSVGRMEVVRRNFREAHRHFRVSAELLREFPCRHYTARLLVSKSALFGVLGELDRSYACASEASGFGKETGDAWTQAAAAINMAHVLGSKGQFEAAEASIRRALSAARDNLHLKLNALDSYVNLHISAGRLPDAEALLDEIAGSQTVVPAARRPFDVMTDTYSRARLHQAQKRWEAAIAQLDRGIELAGRYGDRFWGTRFRLAKARCLSLNGTDTEAVRALVFGNTDGCDLESLALYYAALATIERSNPERQTVHAGRVARLCDGMSNVALAADLLRPVEAEASGEVQLSSADGVTRTPDLEDAVALLDVVEHSNILGREAFSVITRSGCSEALALVVHRHKSIQIVQQHGWSSDDVLTAVGGAEGVDHVEIGERAETTWEIVVRVRQDVQSRCTFAAIRKLISEARELALFRNQERLRSALWPLETTEIDGESLWASEQMAEVLALARRVAPGPLTVLLTGETGTGKEVLARDIHRASGRGDRIFLPFNCTAVPKDMLDSQLFGYRKGAFTGADAAFPGVIRSAEGGTLFLDEIADIPLELQPKLLRFLETHEIHPLGEAQPLRVDVRIVAATNASLEQLVAEGRFRADLFYRLNVVRLKLPPLRHRREEIPALVHHYLRRFGDEQKKGQLTLADETLEYLLLFAWPGNVRQLANEVRRMVALAEPDAVLTPALLSPEIQASRRTIPAAPATAGEPELRLRLDQPLPLAVELLEQAMIRSALRRSRGRVEEAAKLLGISRKGLFLKRRRWNLDRQQAS